MKKTGFKSKTYEEKLVAVKKKKTTKRMIYGTKVWSLTVAHSRFSLWLREKVGRCELCGTTEGLTVSHYIGRKEKATTFDLDNCDVFCWSCHAKWEDRKQYEYREWKINKMGLEKHEELKLKARVGLGEKDAIFNMMKMLGKL